MGTEKGTRIQGTTHKEAMRLPAKGSCMFQGFEGCLGVQRGVGQRRQTEQGRGGDEERKEGKDYSCICQQRRTCEKNTPSESHDLKCFNLKAACQITQQQIDETLKPLDLPKIETSTICPGGCLVRGVQHLDTANLEPGEFAADPRAVL